MRHPVTAAPRVAFSFSASNESAESWCRRWRQTIIKCARCSQPHIPFLFFFCMVIPDLVPMAGKRTGGWKRQRWGRFACKPANSRPTPLSDDRTPPSESVGWLLLLFATEKQLRRIFRAFFRKQIKKSFSVLLGPKVPKSSARRSPREDAPRGAARGAQDQAYAPPRDCRAASRTLFFRVERECGLIVPPLAALIIRALKKFFSRINPRLGSDGGEADGRLKA
ncbi:hypothetical protein [uncultured Alistipes sp.]|uniref:hypothetical protein n=1 Tax=uncultured Alistipes sp. TaxID=538949 RepID=UPI0026119A10|nr:hypothetical protein [uncultured Alistipes sp.]